MTGSLLERAYRRYGPRYLPRVLFIQQQLLYILLVLVLVLVLVLAVAGISAYADMSVGEFARLALVACGLQFLYSLLSLGLTRRLNEPVAAWHEGARSEEATIAGWRAAASFPWEIVRQGLFSVRLGLLAEPTRALLQDGHVPLEERSGVTLKGKREAVALYAPWPDGPVHNGA